MTDETKSTIQNLYGDGLIKSKFEIGRLLRETKDQSSVLKDKAYDLLILDLPFEKGQADKYISIYDCEWARTLVYGENSKSHHFPESFTVLYNLTQKKYSELEVTSVFLEN